MSIAAAHALPRHHHHFAWLALATAAVLAALAAPASAAPMTQSIPASSCHVDTRVANARWEYRGNRLLNRGVGAYDVVFATCGLSLLVPGVQPVEYRILLTDSRRQQTWCDIFDSQGRRVRTATVNFVGSTASVSGSLAEPTVLAESTGAVEMTVQCLLHPGASLDEVEIVWYKP
jgi:hypothetical protein